MVCFRGPFRLSQIPPSAKSSSKFLNLNTLACTETALLPTILALRIFILFQSHHEIRVMIAIDTLVAVELICGLLSLMPMRNSLPTLDVVFISTFIISIILDIAATALRWGYRPVCPHGSGYLCASSVVWYSFFQKAVASPSDAGESLRPGSNLYAIKANRPRNKKAKTLNSDSRSSNPRINIVPKIIQSEIAEDGDLEACYRAPSNSASDIPLSRITSGGDSEVAWQDRTIEWSNSGTNLDHVVDSVYADLTEC
ncbi:hypothetical protein AOL_s00091g45 [Orbilia oligospora ATCC 24927]|uniref:Uncharacterized protein n=1 Tax=Arthrobotrys oligospora (strain ATCC 24927 / CBS 115.81 / DSM 1491) TaxID=756982 RepID=G1XHZ3_ARTOA|nr:hypothetical protein AOL_s00091g45 [Orbilia oligospora ATCC 24927]EGX47224.1 hypothetical protein AOL_s00091g45 [Orbilia oligospora ATCC 24927]